MARGKSSRSGRKSTRSNNRTTSNNGNSNSNSSNSSNSTITKTENSRLRTERLQSIEHNWNNFTPTAKRFLTQNNATDLTLSKLITFFSQPNEIDFARMSISVGNAHMLAYEYYNVSKFENAKCGYTSCSNLSKFENAKGGYTSCSMYILL